MMLPRDTDQPLRQNASCVAMKSASSGCFEWRSIIASAFATLTAVKVRSVTTRKPMPLQQALLELL